MKRLEKKISSLLKPHTQKSINKDKLPRITIITPSYNQGEYLEKTILSVLNQNYHNLEYIIIDGGSTDNSVDIIKSYENNIKYWISEKDGGQTNAINKGIKMATGDIIAFQNSDDIYMPNVFNQVATVYMNVDADLIYGDFLFIDQNDNIINEKILGTAKYWIQLFLGSQIHNQSAFWKRELMQTYGYLNEKYKFCLDYEFFTRLLHNKISATYVNRYFGAFRLHSNAKTNYLGDLKKKEHEEISMYYKNLHSIYKYMPNKLLKLIAQTYRVIKIVSIGRYDYLVKR